MGWVPTQWGRRCQKGSPIQWDWGKSASNLVSGALALDPGFSGDLGELRSPPHPGLIPVRKPHKPHCRLQQAWPLLPASILLACINSCRCWGDTGHPRFGALWHLGGYQTEEKIGSGVCCRHRSWAELIWGGSWEEEASGLAGIYGGSRAVWLCDCGHC